MASLELARLGDTGDLLVVKAARFTPGFGMAADMEKRGTQWPSHLITGSNRVALAWYGLVLFLREINIAFHISMVMDGLRNPGRGGGGVLLCASASTLKKTLR